METEFTSRRTIWMLSNPRAGARESQATVHQLAEILIGQSYDVRQFTDPGDLGQALVSDKTRQVRAVVTAGGDGTANLVAQLAPPDVPLIPLPLGTENLLARYLGYTASPDQIADAISACHVRPFDAGVCNGQLFLLMVGCGFDAEVVRRLHTARKGHISHLTYAAPIFQTVWDYPYPTLSISYHEAEADDDSWQQVEAKWAFIINLPRYAGGLSFAPQASGHDGLLDLCVFRSGSLWKGLYYLANVVIGQHQRLDGCLVARVDRLRIDVADESTTEVPWQFDGDPGGTLPIDVHVLPARVSLIVPPDWESPDKTAEQSTSSNP